MPKSLSAALMLAAMPSLPAAAQEHAAATDTPSETYRKLIECRTLSDPVRRLSCYDDSIAAFEAATRRREIVISDQNSVKKARRSLFGFAAPVGRLMGFGDDDDAEQIEEITSTVSQARRAKEGWRLDLGDGSTWEQNDTRDFVLSPKTGDSVKITRGALGTYFLSVKSQRALRMRRIK